MTVVAAPIPRKRIQILVQILVSATVLWLVNRQVKILPEFEKDLGVRSVVCTFSVGKEGGRWSLYFERSSPRSESTCAMTCPGWRSRLRGTQEFAMSVFSHIEAGRLEILLHTQIFLGYYRPAGTTLTKPRARHGELASLPLPWEPSCELHQISTGQPSSQTYRSSRRTPWWRQISRDSS